MLVISRKKKTRYIVKIFQNDKENAINLKIIAKKKKNTSN